MSDIRKMQVLRVTQALARIQLDQAADVEVLLDVTTDQMITKIKLTIPTELALMERVAALIAERDKLQTARDNALEGYISAEERVGIAWKRASQLTAERDAALAELANLRAEVGGHERPL